MNNAEGATALHWAVVRNSLNSIEALLRAGANKHAKDSRGYQVGTSLVMLFLCPDPLYFCMQQHLLKDIMSHLSGRRSMKN